MIKIIGKPHIENNESRSYERQFLTKGGAGRYLIKNRISIIEMVGNKYYVDKELLPPKKGLLSLLS